MRRHLGDPATFDALDVGCGIGLTDRYLVGRFRSLTGTDLSREALEEAARTNPGVRYELGDRGRLPFEDDAFDVAFAVNVVQVVPPAEQPELVWELARVTRRGGLAVVFEHNPYNPLTRLAVRRWPERTSLLSPGALRRLMRRAGLAPVASGHVLLFPSRRRRLVAMERALRQLPFGAQFYVAGRPG